MWLRMRKVNVRLLQNFVDFIETINLTNTMFILGESSEMVFVEKWNPFKRPSRMKAWVWQGC